MQGLGLIKWSGHHGIPAPMGYLGDCGYILGEVGELTKNIFADGRKEMEWSKKNIEKLENMRERKNRSFRPPSPGASPYFKPFHNPCHFI